MDVANLASGHFPLSGLIGGLGLVIFLGVAATIMAFVRFKSSIRWLIAGSTAFAIVVVAVLLVVAFMGWIPSSQAVLPFTGLRHPYGVAVDAGANVYVADTGNGRVVQLPAGSSTQTALPFTGLHGAMGVAVDAAGNVYVADTGNARVVELAAGSSTQTVPFTDVIDPEALAVDTRGNVYVNIAGQGVNRRRAGSSTIYVLPISLRNGPKALAVDTAGNVYVTDANRVVKLAAAYG